MDLRRFKDMYNNRKDILAMAVDSSGIYPITASTSVSSSASASSFVRPQNFQVPQPPSSDFHPQQQPGFFGSGAAPEQKRMRTLAGGFSSPGSVGVASGQQPGYCQQPGPIGVQQGPGVGIAYQGYQEPNLATTTESAHNDNMHYQLAYQQQKMQERPLAKRTYPVVHSYANGSFGSQLQHHGFMDLDGPYQENPSAGGYGGGAHAQAQTYQRRPCSIWENVASVIYFAPGQEEAIPNGKSVKRKAN